MTDTELSIQTDANNYKELYGKLRNVINANRDAYRKALVQVKEEIEQKKEELELLKAKKSKLEGAIEVSDQYLTAVLPSSAKK
jgi:SMC interacting uncharacterized protein involved in chromosome segregation